ncbi:CHD5 domain-containing protein [Trichophyton equinum CBS 127.97]|uniref:CHD5 domain-containing protein n=1 Tax=Trichophyton equinum (strain ATCC MYA-4606 / CBS 127.97) TaxID=559882 RepID=F2PMN4_TRIEC|nr:CHD5 domain-containing protein [Trichophyton equinum CBS 127.97]
MASLLLFVLAIQIITYLINTIGASTIDSLLWLLYIKLPNQASQTAREQRQAKLEVIQLKREMGATSSQDEFAKWAKLRRRHDKAMEEYDVKNKKLNAMKVSFDWTIKTVRWAFTTGGMDPIIPPRSLGNGEHTALVGGAVAAVVPALKSSKQSKGPAVAQKTGTPRGSREQTPTRKTQ